MYSCSTEIRHMSSADIYKIGQILDQTNSWKKLMRIIPKDPFSKDADTFLKYNNDHIRLIENASIKQSRMSTEILFDEWGTSGRKRPTVGILLDLLVKAELFRAADFVALNFLNEPAPERPAIGPAAKIDISIPLDSAEIQEIEDALGQGSYYPNTNTLIENAQLSVANNNKDFYEKYGRNEKKITFEPSDLIKLSSDKLTTIENIPKITELILNNSTGSDITYSDISTESTEIPNLSAFNIQSSQPNQLPNLSALNFEDTEFKMSSDNSPILSNASSPIDDCNLTPNLSILDQRSPNDSSLTSVTETSEDNSFESNASSIPDDNIPCLSFLNK